MVNRVLSIFVNSELRRSSGRHNDHGQPVASSGLHAAVHGVGRVNGGGGARRTEHHLGLHQALETGPLAG